MKTILVTGSLGTIGKALSAELLVRGNRLFGCDLPHAEHQHGFSIYSASETDNYYRADVGCYREIARVIDAIRPELVYHCAAEFGRWNGEDYYERLWQTNAVGTKNIIRLQELYRFQLVHFSSSEVYGDYSGIMAESVMTQIPVHQLSDYAISKWANELQIGNSRTQQGTESVIVRLFNTYGPGEYYSPYRSVNCRFLYCALHNLPLIVFRGHSRTSTYVSDCVRTLANISEKFVPGAVYNIGGNEQHSIETLAEMVLACVGAPKTLIRYCDSEILTTKQKHVDTSRAVSELDHKVETNLTTGIFLTSLWMRSVYGLNRLTERAKKS